METVTPMQRHPDYPDAWTLNVTLTESTRQKLVLVDEQGRNNKYPPELIARVIPNRPPSLKLTQGGDLTVSPLEEVELGAEIRDDFGIDRAGLSYTFDRQPAQEIVLAEEMERGEKRVISQLLAFEELQAEPDQLLSYYFWAEDTGPDGQPRRTESDMFFAEVRPFDEIFRAGEQPPGGQQQQQQQQQQQSQNGQQAEELAELQKQIISSTWRVIRDERGTVVSDDFKNNLQLIMQGQADALSQLEELAEAVQDEKSVAILDSVRNDMQDTLDQLAMASEQLDVKQLPTAMGMEQAAYGGLLRLRAREFEVTRQQQQQSQSRSQSQSRQRRSSNSWMNSNLNRTKIVMKHSNSPKNPVNRLRLTVK